MLRARGKCEEGEQRPQARCQRRASCSQRVWVLSQSFVGGKVQGVVPEQRLESKVSYFLGNHPVKHRAGVATYRQFSLGEVPRRVCIEGDCGTARLPAMEQTVRIPALQQWGLLGLMVLLAGVAPLLRGRPSAT